MLLSEGETVPQDMTDKQMQLEDAIEWKEMWKKPKQTSAVQIMTDPKLLERVKHFNHLGSMINR